MPLKVVNIKGSKNLYIRGTYRGVRVYQSTGTRNRKTADEDRKALEDEIDAKGRVAKRRTFSEAVMRYLDSGRSDRYLSDINEDGTWKPGVMQQFENRYLDELDQMTLDDGARKAFPNVKPQTLNRHFYTPFIAVMNFAAQDGLCEFRQWRRPRAGQPERRKWFTYEDAAKFYDASPEHLKAIFVFCVYTGARITETIELKCRDISLDNRWTVLSQTKTGGHRGVPVHAVLVRAFSAYRESIDSKIKEVTRKKGARLRVPDEAFATRNFKPYIPHRLEDGTVQGGGYFKTVWKSTLKNAGLTGYTPYSMRHTFNNWLIMAGIDQATREALMGHDNGSTNAIYSDAPQAHLIAAIDCLPDFTSFSRLKQKNHDSFSQNSAENDKVEGRKKAVKHGAVEQD